MAKWRKRRRASEDEGGMREEAFCSNMLFPPPPIIFARFFLSTLPYPRFCVCLSSSSHFLFRTLSFPYLFIYEHRLTHAQTCPLRKCTFCIHSLPHIYVRAYFVCAQACEPALRQVGALEVLKKEWKPRGWPQCEIRGPHRGRAVRQHWQSRKIL